MDSFKFKAALGLLRLSLGLVFLWAFVDKLWGLGFATTPEHAWVTGSSPTAGFLANAVHGPFTNLFHSMAGNPLVDWLFMLGLLFVGLTLTLGVLVKLGGYAGALMMLLMYLAIGIQPENHPFIDEHIIYLFSLLLVGIGGAGKYFGLGRHWSNTTLVQRNDWLR